MINRQSLLADLQSLLKRLETDLQERSESSDVPEVGQTLRAEYERAKNADRTAENYEDWRSGAITQTAAAWVLSCVFVRFLEDNRLIDPPKIAGPNERLQRARDEHELYFRAHPKENDRDYLITVFDQLAKLLATADIFGEHNALRELPNWLSGDAAGELLRFFQKIDANTGTLIHDFTDPDWDTRFLGDLYQDLSEAARKKYALLQTPEFVEEFILERTLEPALDEFGLEPHAKAQRRKEDEALASSSLGDFAPLRESVFKMIDPACGSGHFLLGSFRRILERWQRREPGTNVRELVQRTLDSVHGVDVNPFAIAIARFRLLLAAMRACGIERLADAPAFRLNLVCGDSLLHAPLAAGGKKYTAGQQELDFALASDPADSDECDHAYRSENLPELKRLLRGGQYHAVVANPPYIVPKDRQLNERYRRRFLSCHRQYSLSVPFLERIFRLAVGGGYTGQITANSFMKREFGKKLIESFFPTVDLTHVIDTSGAYIPGHGTPTVILFGRHRPPLASTLRSVLGIRGEPSTPEGPARGMVWSAIGAQLDQPGSQSEFVSVGDSSRELFHKHPWSIGGGGIAELKSHLEDSAEQQLEAVAASIGFASFTGTDEIFLLPPRVLNRFLVPPAMIRPTILGDNVRDWRVENVLEAFAPYDIRFDACEFAADEPWGRYMWHYRTTLGSVISFGGRTRLECGDQWWTWYRWVKDKYRSPLSLIFAFVATHNHFVLDRGKSVFNRSAPVIKVSGDATVDDHLGLLGLLNASVAGFFMRQSAHNMGDSTDDSGARTTGDPAFNTFQFNSTQVGKVPLPHDRPVKTAIVLDELANYLNDLLPASIVSKGLVNRRDLETAKAAADRARSQMIAAQEELDWECYRLYGLIEEDLTQRREAAKEDKNSSDLCASAPLREPPPLSLGQRAFEIVLARKMAAGQTQTTWFARHGSTPITELPAEWPDDYRQLVQRRIDLIESDPNIRLIEQPEYKRRWNTEPWDSQLERALREWLLDRLESYFDFDGRMQDLTQRRKAAKEDKEFQTLCASAPLREICLYSIARLADIARQDAEFQQVGELYRDDPAFDVQKLVEALVAAESVPLLPILRYKESGLRKRAEWEKTWELQRREDEWQRRKEAEGQSEGDHSATLPLSPSVPPKYTSADFISTGEARYWSLRGKLDVPKERWISLPYCEGNDGTLMLAWAGYDHLQQARTISAHYVDIQERLGGRDDPRLVPLLACLIELLPWLKQWHNEVDPEYGVPMGDYFEGFINEEARNLPRPDGGTGWTLDEINAWEPPKKGAKGHRRRGAKQERAKEERGRGAEENE